MEAAAYEEMRTLEDHHWWFRGRRRRVRRLLADGLQALRGGSGAAETLEIAEIGCGTGGNLAHLLAEISDARCLGVDPDGLALRYCRDRGLSSPLLRSTGESLPLAADSLDLILATDIVEHIADDAAALEEFRRVLRPGGQLIATVPQYPSLWSPHDDFLHHVRRYRSGELERKLSAAGFRVVRREGFNLLLLFPIAVVRWLKSALARRSDRPKGSDFAVTPAFMDSIFGGLLSLETPLARRLPVPLGLSLMIRAEKKDPGRSA